MSILIVAPKHDKHAQAVLGVLGPEAKLLDPEEPGLVTFRPNKQSPLDADVVWLRRARTVGVDPSMQGRDASFARGEFFSFFVGAAQASRGRWVNPLLAAVGNDSGYGKLNQLAVARRLGLRIPKTVSTNDPDVARAFVEQAKEVCFKPFNAGPMAAYTAYVRKGTDLSSVRLAPGIFQYVIPKVADVRVVVMGDTVMATAIETTKLDFRPDLNVPHAPIELPADIVRKLVALNRALGLEFSVMDLVLRPDGRFVFLEANQQGQFLWLEEKTGQPYLHTFCDFLRSRVQ